MKFTHYKSAKAFEDDVLELLKHNELQNELMFKNIGDAPHITMLTVKDDDGKVLLTANRTGSLPMTMYETDNIRNDKVVEFLAKSLKKNNIDVDFIMTEKSLAQSFVDFYGKLSGKSFRPEKSLVSYKIERTNELPKVNGHLRKATEDDMYFLPYWWADFNPACGLGEYDLRAAIDNALKTIQYGSVYVWEDKQPVSLAIAGREINGKRVISLVYTPPQLRGNGYSTACVGTLTKQLLESGYQACFLYADCANPYSNAVYRKIGYVEQYWFDQYKAD